MKIITIIIINYSAQKSKWLLFSNLYCGGFGGNLPETQNEWQIHSFFTTSSKFALMVGTNWWVSLVGHAEGLVIRSTPTGKLRLLVVTSVGWLAPAINTGSKGPYQSGMVWGKYQLHMATNLVGICGNTSLVPVLYRSPYQIYIPA
jgi:hypothetical protein